MTERLGREVVYLYPGLIQLAIEGRDLPDWEDARTQPLYVGDPGQLVPVVEAEVVDLALADVPALDRYRPKSYGQAIQQADVLIDQTLGNRRVLAEDLDLALMDEVSAYAAKLAQRNAAIAAIRQQADQDLINIQTGQVTRPETVGK
jgi:hypothetical protein